MPNELARTRAVHSDDGAIVMNIERGTLFSLNATGSVAYELLAKGFDEQAIAQEIALRFNVSLDTAKQDLRKFLEALRVHDLHSEVPPPRNDL
jgi:hypothetical protein